MSNRPLFDRLIDVRLIRSISQPQGSVNDSMDVSLNLKCPRSGIKPDITVKGSFAANILYNAELRMKNFYSPINLDPGDGTGGYKWIQVVAGYASSLQVALEGQIWTAYQTQPPPDGETVFSFFTGWFAEWVTTPISLNYPEGTAISTILNFVCSKASAVNPGMLTVDLFSSIPESRVTKSKISANTTIANFCTEFARNENLVIVPDGSRLRAYSRNMDLENKGTKHKIEFVNDIKKTAAGLTITAPWIPSIRPGDTVTCDYRYFSSDVSGMFVKLGSDLLVINVDFEFCTIGTTNKMILQTVGEQK